MSEPLAERLAKICVGGEFPFRDNPRLVPFLNDVGLHCDGVHYWEDELGMDAPDRLDKLPWCLNEALSILCDHDKKVMRSFGCVETNFLRLCGALRREGHDDVSERLPQLIEDLKVIGATAPKAHYARPPGPNSAPGLVEVVRWLANFWEAETKTVFTRLWHKGEPVSPAMQFVFEVVGDLDPSGVSRLSTITKKVIAARNK